jgi:hypothetical protein
MPDEATIQVGDRIRIEPFDEEGEVYKFEDYGSGVAIGVIFRPSNRAETLILSHEELARRVKRVPALWQDFAAGALPRDAFLLFVDALRLRLAHTFDPYYAVSVTQVDLLPHQVDAVYQHILPMPCVRFLLADDPGLGKTIMAGLVLKELKARGDGASCPARRACTSARPMAARDERLVPRGLRAVASRCAEQYLHSRLFRAQPAGADLDGFGAAGSRCGICWRANRGTWWLSTKRTSFPPRATDGR